MHRLTWVQTEEGAGWGQFFATVEGVAEGREVSHMEEKIMFFMAQKSSDGNNRN